MSEQFTDEELAFLRHVRFGQAPERVRPEQVVPLVESEQPQRDSLADDPFGHLKNAA